MQNALGLSLIATAFTWFMTALGAAGVFIFRKPSRTLLDGMLGFAAGIMIAASFWSLLVPAIEISENSGAIKWLPPLIGFLLGGAILWLIDKILPHLHSSFSGSKREGIKTHWHKTFLLFLAITLHNFPEGLAIGVAIGAAAITQNLSDMNAAIALAIGIGIQNFPEGFAVSMPFKRSGFSRLKSFMYGQASALVEPLAAVLGVIAVSYVTSVLPYALAFAAGAMIYVSIEEIIPESQQNQADIATIGAMLGFAIMMVLDVAFS
jgi:ZIP family zinc transporter